MKKGVALLAAALAACCCDLRAAAWEGQQAVSVRAGGLRRLDVAAVEEQLGGSFERLAVTLAPQRAVLYLDGEPLGWGRPLTRAEAARVFLFSPEERVSLGVLPLAGSPPPRRPRIRCINPVFPGDTKGES